MLASKYTRWGFAVAVWFFKLHKKTEEKEQIERAYSKHKMTSLDFK